MQNEKAQQTYELERMRGVGPFRHVVATEETTRQVEGGQSQLETNAWAPGMFFLAANL